MSIVFAAQGGSFTKGQPYIGAAPQPMPHLGRSGYGQRSRALADRLGRPVPWDLPMLLISDGMGNVWGSNMH